LTERPYSDFLAERGLYALSAITTLAAWGEFLGGIAVVVSLMLGSSAELRFSIYCLRAQR